MVSSTKADSGYFFSRRKELQDKLQKYMLWFKKLCEVIIGTYLTLCKCVDVVKISMWIVWKRSL